MDLKEENNEIKEQKLFTLPQAKTQIGGEDKKNAALSIIAIILTTLGIVLYIAAIAGFVANSDGSLLLATNRFIKTTVGLSAVSSVLFFSSIILGALGLRNKTGLSVCAIILSAIMFLPSIITMFSCAFLSKFSQLF
ncbi:MAG: hypothetical protein GX891_04930 [Clostridiales bacterium]|nr:hypothetical protein [Clostridiales bacterium]